MTAISYCIWDVCFTHHGVWGLNNSYLLGTYLWNLPIEEVLFFVCIPYACVFTFDSAAKLFPEELVTRGLTVFNYFLAIIWGCFAIIFRSNAYTVAAFASPALIILLAALKKIAWMKRFY